MKSILSPYDDTVFNEYLLEYTKKYLKSKCYNLTKDYERKYYLDEDKKKYNTPDDIIDSLSLNRRTIYFKNKKLVNYAVYDLGQIFWYDCIKQIALIVPKLHFEFKARQRSYMIQQRNIERRKLEKQTMS